MTYDILIHGTGQTTVLQINEQESKKPVATLTFAHKVANLIATATHCVAKDYIARYEVEGIEGEVELPHRRRK